MFHTQVATVNNTNNNNTNNNNNKNACDFATARFDADEACEAATNHVISDFVTGQIPPENDIQDLCTSSCRRLVS